MKKLFLTVAVILYGIAASAQLRVEVPGVVSADEQFNVTFVYEGENSPSGFEFEPGDDFNLVWGPQEGRSTSVQIINGKRTKSSQFTYTYILMPKKTGTAVLPSASLTVKGKKMKTDPVEITVVSEGAAQQNSQTPVQGASDISSDNLFLKMTLSKTDVVVGEPIVATLKLYQKVNIAGFEDARFPSFNGFWNQEIEAPTNIEFKRESYNDKLYNSAILRKYVIIPQQSGTLTIDPAELVCLVNVKTVSSGSVSIFDEFFNEYRTVRKRITTPEYKIKVTPLPSGAPSSFHGGVGEFRISAKLSRDSISTHEAASLIISLTGKGNVSLIEAPDVVFPPDFEVYDTKITEKTDKATGGTSGTKIFEFPFIPRSAGDFAIAPVKYTYYDVNVRKYVTVETPLLPFSVIKGNEQPSSASIPSAVVSKHGVKNLNLDIRFIDKEASSLAPSGYFFAGSAMFWILIALPLAVAVILYFIFRALASRRADVAGTKTRRATKMARKRLKSAENFLNQNLHSAFYEELHKALIGYISDKLNIAVADLSKDRISGSLESMGVDGGLINDFLSIVDECEFARYSPDSGNKAMSEHYQKAINVISMLDSNMKNKKTTAMKAGAAVVLLMLAMPFAGYASDAYTDSLWTKASEAYSAGMWQDAADLYESIEDLGLESPALYGNAGNAYFKMNDYSKAILYYERALKLDPSYSNARYNLQVASDFIQDRIDTVPEFILKTWTRNLCYWLSSDTWAAVGLVSFGLVLVFALLFLLSRSIAARRTGFFSAIVFVLFAAVSLSFSFSQKHEYMNKNGAIIMTPVISVKSSPSSETSTDLFILHEGTKVKIIDEVGDWRNIELADGRQGWMQSKDMEVI